MCVFMCVCVCVCVHPSVQHMKHSRYVQFMTCPFYKAYNFGVNFDIAGVHSSQDSGCAYSLYFLQNIIATIKEDNVDGTCGITTHRQVAKT